jgi:CRP/FNR family transcriptional regulator
VLPKEYSDLFIKNFSFWEHLSHDEKTLLVENAKNVRFQKGAGVHNENNDCSGILLVKSGQLRTYMLSDDGRDITLYRMFSGDVCIMSAACVLEEVTFDVFIDAVEDTELLIIATAAFNRLAENNIYVKCFAYEQATARFSDVMWAMQQILFMSVDQRLAIFLIDEFSKEKSDKLRITHEQIARYMGSAREVVSRMLKYFEQDGIVRLSRGGVEVTDKEKLRKLAGMV